MAKTITDEMSFLDHLEDLRWHLIRITVSILVVATVAYIFSDLIFEHIIFFEYSVATEWHVYLQLIRDLSSLMASNFHNNMCLDWHSN